MKIALLLLASLPLAAYAASPTRAARTFKPPTPSFVAKDSALKLRGGDLGPISSENLAKTFGTLAIGDALFGTIKPIDVWRKFGVTIEPGSKGEHFLGHGMAASAASLAVTSLLALSGTTSTKEAIGYGFLARCAYMTEMLLTNKYEDLGVPVLPHIVVYLLLLTTSGGLIGGAADGGTMAKVVSLLLAGHGALLFANPRIDGDDTTKAMARFDGGYMFISSLFASLLAFGVSPTTAMGYVAIFCPPLFLRLFDLMTVDELFGLGTGAWQFIFVVFTATFGLGILNGGE